MPHVEDVVSAERLHDATPATWRTVITLMHSFDRRRPAHYLRGLGIIVVLYTVLYGTLLGVTRGVPYVSDGNESFSMLLHASNMYSFPLSHTLGLSDEALSRHPGAHPYVYTHQGNFPRLFVFVLYAVGARTVESQIIISTFTVGLLAVFIIYRYFALVAGPLFAFIACVVAFTDYIFFVQWHVNTFRVWHSLLFFLPLLCVHGVGDVHRRRWLILTVITFACLFYFELAFATFVAVMAGLYAGVQYFRRPALLARCWAAQAAGSLLAIAILAGQLIGYLGWADFVEDLRLTYTARNLVAQDPAYIDRIREFVESRKLVFWYNFASADRSRSAADIVSSIADGYFNVFTPTLWYVLTIVLAGWALGLVRPRSQAFGVEYASHRSTSCKVVRITVPGLLFAVALTRFLLAVVHPDALIGVGGPRLLADIDEGVWPVFIAAILAAVLSGAIARTAAGRWWAFGRLRTYSVLAAAGLLLLAEHILLRSGPLFASSLRPLWEHVHRFLFPGWIVQIVIVIAALIGVLLAMGVLSTTEGRSRALVGFLSCGVIAYAAVYALNPGYVHSGYLVRFAPLLSFVVQVFLSLVLYLSWRGVSHLLVIARARRETWRLSDWFGIRLWAACCALLLVFTAVFWINLQITLAQLLPATHFLFAKQLGLPPFRGASFAVNTYAAPVYAYTGQWAYFDTRLGLPDGGLVSDGDSGVVIKRDARSYLWLADRDRNPDYLRPDYFLCVWYQDLSTAVSRLLGHKVGCASAGTVKYAGSNTPLSVADRIIARDPTGRDNWAIVKLDWSVPERVAGVHRSDGGD